MVEGTAYGARIVAVEAFTLAHAYVVGGAELLGQHLQQVLRSLGSRPRQRGGVVVSVIDHLSEELQLAPQVVAQRPPGKVLNLLLPAASVSHIQHASLEPCNDRGTEGEILEHVVLREPCKLGVLPHERLCQPRQLPAFHQSACLRQIVDVGFQLLVEGSVVSAVYGYRRAARPALYSGEGYARHGTVGHHLLEVVAAFFRRARSVPVEAHLHGLRNRLCAHAVLSVLPRVERQLHDAEVLVRLSLQCIKEIQLVHLRVEKVSLSLLHPEHEGRVRHVDVHLLNDETFGSLPAVLVGSLAVAFILPFLLPPALLRVAPSYVRHDAVYGLRDAFLSRTGGSAEDGHERGFVFHVVDVAEAHAAQMSRQWGEHSRCNGILVYSGRFRYEQLYECRQFSGQLLHVVEVRALLLRAAEVFRVESPRSVVEFRLRLRHLQRPSHDARHPGVLFALAGTVYGGERLLPVLAERWYNLLDPFRVIVAHVAQIAGQCVDEGVSRAVGRFAAEQGDETFYYECGVGSEEWFFECGVWSVKCGVFLVWGKWSGECSVSVLRALFAFSSTFLTPHSTLLTQIKDFLIQKEQVVLRCSGGEEHPCQVLCPTVVFYAQQLRRPPQVLLLRQFRTAAEHDMKTLVHAPLQHQQSQFLPAAEDSLGSLPHQSVVVGRRRVEIHVHAHRRCHPCSPLQRAVVVGQTRVVHLHQSALRRCVAAAGLSQVSHLLRRASQFHVFLL